MLARPYVTRDSVVGIDERPVALRRASRPGRPMRRAEIPVEGRFRAMAAPPSARSFTPRAVGHRDVAHVDGSCGRWRSRCCSYRPRLWEIAAAMLLVSTGAVGDRTRDVAHVFRRVAGHRLAVTWSYRVRCLTLVRVWEMALRTLPTSSGVLPGPCWLLSGRTWYVA